MQMTMSFNSDQHDSTAKVHCVVKGLKRHCLARWIRWPSSPQCKCWFLILFFQCSSVGFQANAADKSSMQEIDTATTQLSESGRYEVSFNSIAGPIVINTIHEWRLTVLSTDGMPVDGLSITIDGGMPMHNHGLPTAPRVTESLGEGQYRVEGFKFQMPGHWTTTFELTDKENVSDSVTFNLML